jgi:hypothetical protein
MSSSVTLRILALLETEVCSIRGGWLNLKHKEITSADDMSWINSDG